jgi:hypothetical protein
MPSDILVPILVVVMLAFAFYLWKHRRAAEEQSRVAHSSKCVDVEQGRSFFSESLVFPQAIVECPAGHAMEMLSSGSSWRCDVCKTSQHENPRLRCRRCDYDMCKTCIPSGCCGVASGLHGHSGQMECKCCHELGKISFPLNKRIIHLNGTCVWTCCGESWEESKCSRIPSAKEEDEAFQAALKASAEAVPPKWSCAACTLLNPEPLVECTACGGRERAARPPPTRPAPVWGPGVFYHGTSLEAAMNIQKVGFDVHLSGSNAGATLGRGLYVTTTLQKALNYAERNPCQGAIFELRVQLGRCYKVTVDDRNMKKWQEMGYDSAWAAQGIIGEREENCIKDPRPPRVVIQNITLGHTGEAKRAGYWVEDGKLRKK